MGNVSTSCSLPHPTIAVKTVAHLAHACAGCSGSHQVTRVHLLLSGIELHQAAVANESSPECRSLLRTWPGTRNGSTLSKIAVRMMSPFLRIVTGQISPEIYNQIRLRLAAPSFQLVDQPCSSLDAGCVVAADGSSYPLQTIEGHPYLRIEVMVPIDLRTDQSILLRIEFRPDWALQVSSTGVRDVLPLLRGRVAIEPVPATDLP